MEELKNRLVEVTFILYVGGLICQETVCSAISSLTFCLLKILNHSQRVCGSQITFHEFGGGIAILCEVILLSTFLDTLKVVAI